ncbi:MAG: hypothetical protein JWR23_2403 [Mucilaginibacter sp.]|nr:hypothetical protein [Mucilaginibacter sp.]
MTILIILIINNLQLRHYKEPTRAHLEKIVMTYVKKKLYKTRCHFDEERGEILNTRHGCLAGYIRSLTIVRDDNFNYH